jgi:pyruvate/2-oxoglutarate dehydrogenase complex dihydrolipoamide dehydrogenase (E3) component
MAQPEHYDILILGSGGGGKLMAWHMGHSGKRTAVIERRYIGGSCPNIACLPSKNEVWSAKVAYLARHGAQFGTLTGNVSVDMVAVRQRKRAMVDDLIAIHLRNYASSGAELVMGSGHFIGPKTIEVHLNDGGSRVLSGDKVMINTGSRAAIPDMPGIEAAKPLTHIEALDLDRLPDHLLVFGGGYVGLELAQMYRRFGSRVTIIEQGPRLMGREDLDVAEAVKAFLVEEGIEVLESTEVVDVQGISGERVTATAVTQSGERKIEGSDILLAAGRVANTSGIGLSDAGVELDPRGYIHVNDRLETSAPNVWALGDCAGSPQFTHVTEDDFRIVRDNLAGANRSTHGRLVPYCMFTDPQLAHVGLSEMAAEREGIAVRVGKLPMNRVFRAMTNGETSGFMKVLVGATDDRILGFTMVGADAGEVMAVVQTAMLAEMPFTKMRDAAILAHPTMAEGLGFLFAEVPA